MKAPFFFAAGALVVACGGATTTDPSGAGAAGGATSPSGGDTASGGAPLTGGTGGAPSANGGALTGGGGRATGEPLTGGAGTAGAATAGAASTYVAGKTVCGATSCDSKPDSYCCFEGGSESPQCARTDSPSPCQNYPQTALHCDSSADCDQVCTFHQLNRLAFCDIDPDGVEYVQLCDPKTDTCKVGSCQATTLGGKLPPGLHACL